MTNIVLFMLAAVILFGLGVYLAFSGEKSDRKVARILYAFLLGSMICAVLSLGVELDVWETPSVIMIVACRVVAAATGVAGFILAYCASHEMYLFIESRKSHLRSP